MSCFDEGEDVRAHRRSFISSSGCSFYSSGEEEEEMFERVQKYVAPLQPAWFESSRASWMRNLEHMLCERDSTIAELQRVLCARRPDLRAGHLARGYSKVVFHAMPRSRAGSETASSRAPLYRRVARDNVDDRHTLVFLVI